MALQLGRTICSLARNRVRTGLTFREEGPQVVKSPGDAFHDLGVSGLALLDVRCWNQKKQRYTPLRTRSFSSLAYCIYVIERRVFTCEYEGIWKEAVIA
jgi:hypothetical protein